MKTTIYVNDAGRHLDDLFKAHRLDTVFILGPGTFYVQGGWGFDKDFDHTVLGACCELIGSGMDQTRIEVLPGLGVPENATQIECLTAGSRRGESEMTVIRDLTISCPTKPSHVKKPVGIIGIHVWSNSCVIKNVRVENVTGAPEVPPVSREGFGVLINKSGSGQILPIGRAIVENVEVFVVPNSENSLTFLTGFYCGYLGATEYSVCNNIRVHNGFATPASVAFGVNDKVLGSQWQSYGAWTRGIYCDVHGGQDVLITNSAFEVTSTFVEFQTHGAETWRNIVVSNSVATFKPRGIKGDYCAGLVLMDYSKDRSGRFNQVSLQGCTFRVVTQKTLPSDFPFYSAGASAVNQTECGLARCVKFWAHWADANANKSKDTPLLFDY